MSKLSRKSYLSVLKKELSNSTYWLTNPVNELCYELLLNQNYHALLYYSLNQTK